MATRKAISPRQGQRGTVLLLVTFSAIAMLAFAAFAIDISRMFVVKSQLQDAADAGALRAAKALDGTGQGVVGPSGALAKGIEAALTNRFLLVSDPLQSSDLKVEVSANPAGPWTLASTVSPTAANNYSFARVTATKAGITSFFGEFAGVWNAQATALAVAGRYTVAITPIGICAPDLSLCPPNGDCGFDKGFAYNVAELNPLGPGTPFYVDPMGSPTCNYTSASAFGPFVCVGKSAISGLPGSIVYTNTGTTAVAFSQIDSRFGDYAAAGKCDPATAPPDTNVMQYFCVPGGTDTKACATTAKPGRKDEIAADWMQFAAGSDFGDPATGKAYRQAVTPPPKSSKPWDEGVVWASVRPGASPTYGRGVNANYPSSCDPLLDPNCDVLTGGTPYGQPNGTTYSIGPSSSYTPVPHRRLMNLVILDCPAAGGACRPATVMAVGEFLLTRKTDVPSDKNVYVEFRRLRSVGGLQSEIRLYR
jgi:Flp pilus assembly protein TadG